MAARRVVISMAKSRRLLDSFCVEILDPTDG
jgi:hypothetical protein